MKTLTLIALLLVSPAVFADDAAQPKTTDAAQKIVAPAKLTADELQVAAHYHALNLKEIDLGTFALRATKNPGVRDYAKMLIKDHGEADKKLLAFARGRNVRIPAEAAITPEDKQAKADANAMVKKLKRLKSVAFDDAYLAMMVTGHEGELAKLDAMIARVSDPELADYVRNKKETLTHHAEAARALQIPTPTASSTVITPGTTAAR